MPVQYCKIAQAAVYFVIHDYKTYCRRMCLLKGHVINFIYNKVSLSGSARGSVGVILLPKAQYAQLDLLKVYFYYINVFPFWLGKISDILLEGGVIVTEKVVSSYPLICYQCLLQVFL